MWKTLRPSRCTAPLGGPQSAERGARRPFPVRSTADANVSETGDAHLCRIADITQIHHHRRADQFLHVLEIERAEHIPLRGEDDDC